MEAAEEMTATVEEEILKISSSELSVAKRVHLMHQPSGSEISNETQEITNSIEATFINRGLSFFEDAAVENKSDNIYLRNIGIQVIDNEKGNLAPVSVNLSIANSSVVMVQCLES